MDTFLLVLAVGTFVVVSTAVWGIIIDGTIHRTPSEWLASVYLGVFVILLGSVSVILDQIISHVFLAAIIGGLVLTVLIWLTVLLWAKVKKLDEAYYRKRRKHSGN